MIPEGGAAAGPEPSGLGLGGAAEGSRRLNLPPPEGAFASVVVVVDCVVSPPSSDARRTTTLETSRTETMEKCV